MDYAIEFTGTAVYEITPQHHAEMKYNFTVLTTASNVFDAMDNGRNYLDDMFKREDTKGEVYVDSALVRRHYE